MICYQTEEYQDADDRRGILVWNNELEPEDSIIIKEQILEKITDEKYEDKIDVILINYINDEEVYFNVPISDYLAEKEFNKIKEEYETK